MTAIRKITIYGMMVNVLLATLKFTIGFLGRSSACIADAVHSLSDMLTDVIVLVGERYWSAPADIDHPHGHKRIEALITAIVGGILAIGAISMGVNAVKLIASNRSLTVPEWSVFFIALLSIISKEILYQVTAVVGQRARSTAVVANAWHHRSDAISSIPVALAALAGRIWPSVTFLDPIATILISCMLMQTAWKITWPCLQELSDQGVDKTQLEHMRQIASSIAGIRDVHKMRTRRLGSGILLDMHILVDKDMTVEDGHRLCEQAASTIQQRMPMVLEVMTHMEPEKSVNIASEIEKLSRSVNGVKEIHNIRIRTTLSGYDADLHVLVDASMSVADGHAICTQVQNELLNGKLNIVSVLTHLEPFVLDSHKEPKKTNE